MFRGTNFFEKLTVGENFPATSHLVKYSHHSTGQARFSLSGKVRTDVQKKSVPLSQANGHIFTVRFQGFSHFDELVKNEKSTKKRGIVSFSFAGENIESIKFVCHYYSEEELGKKVQHKDPTPWTKVLLPDWNYTINAFLF